MTKRWAKTKGFTIVELLIVIVIIGILAAVVIVAYNGITNNAKVSSVRVDLENASKLLEIYKHSNSTSDYPTAIDCSASPAANTTCLRSSNGATYSYAGGNGSYCLKETYGTITYSVSSDNSAPTSSVCIAGVVTTFAGSTNGYANGTGTEAQFSYLGQGITLDSAGNVYISDYLNYRVRKITPAGVVTTFAGSGTAGSANGTGTAAQFAGPNGMAFDSSGNLYVADQPNNVIRKITPGGVVTTFAGSGADGKDDGTGTAATFSGPASVGVDGSNNVYVADYVNSLIRKITPAGVVTTLAGSPIGAGYADGTGSAAAFSLPNQLFATSDGTIYVSDTGNNRIRKVTSTGVVTTYAGDGTAGLVEGNALSARFNNPLGLWVTSDGTVYVADQGNARVRKINANGTVSTLAGSTSGFTDGTGTAAQFNNIGGVAATSDGTLYIMDRNNFVVRKIQ